MDLLRELFGPAGPYGVTRELSAKEYANSEYSPSIAAGTYSAMFPMCIGRDEAEVAKHKDAFAQLGDFLAAARWWANRRRSSTALARGQSWASSGHTRNCSTSPTSTSWSCFRRRLCRA